MNNVEERLREALRAHAEEFTAHPDAWRRLTSGRRRRAGSRWRSFRLSGPALIPVAAAAAVVAVIYAHADVARVVLRAGGRQLASAATMAAGWPGSGLRLWRVRVPLNAQQAASGTPAITATAYDAAGHVLGQARLGQLP